MTTPPDTAKDIRQFIAASVFVVLLVLLIGYLTFIPVPEANKDLIVTILGVIVGGGAVAMQSLFGGVKTEEAQKLREKLIRMETKFDTLKDEHDKLMTMLVENHVVKAE